MRILKTVLLSLCVLLLFSGFLFSGGQQDVAGKAEEVNLSLMHDKGGVPNFQPYFENQGKMAKAAVGIGITPTPYPSTDIFSAAVRSALPTNNAPDLFTWWSTYRMKQLVDQDMLADLTSVWDNHKNEYSSGIREAFTFNGKVYGFPYNVEYWVLHYNKKVFKQLGLTEPKTWEEFIKICDTMKANGITPMMATVQGRWPTFIVFENMIIGQDPDLYVDLCNGRVKYSDALVKKAFLVWKDMINKGYFTNPSTDIFADGPGLFSKGKVGMALMGTWFFTSVLTANGVDENNIGLFILPSHNASAGKNVIMEVGPMLVAKNAPHLKDAIKVADWWMGPKGSANFAKMLTSYPPNTEADASYLPAVKVKLLKTIKEEKYKVLNRYWEATPTPICETAVDDFAKFMLKPDSLDEVLNDLDKVADNYWSKNK